jgi:hypothetical protein
MTPTGESQTAEQRRCSTRHFLQKKKTEDVTETRMTSEKKKVNTMPGFDMDPQL